MIIIFIFGHATWDLKEGGGVKFTTLLRILVFKYPRDRGKETLLSLAMSSLHGGSLEITLTVPVNNFQEINIKMSAECCQIISYQILKLCILRNSYK